MFVTLGDILLGDKYNYNNYNEKLFNEGCYYYLMKDVITFKSIEEKS